MTPNRRHRAGPVAQATEEKAPTSEASRCGPRCRAAVNGLLRPVLLFSGG